MKTKYLPGLDPMGWISDVNQVIERLFGHFFLSDYSQTAIYPKAVSSFAKVMSNYDTYDVINLIVDLRTTLTNYYKNYFDQVICEVSESTDPDYPADSSRFSLVIYLEVVDNDKSYLLTRAIEVVNGKTASIIKLNNDGTEPK
jgi:hypothetical protein